MVKPEDVEASRELCVEVSLLLARAGARGSKRTEAARLIGACCSYFLANQMNGAVQSVAQSDWDAEGTTIFVSIAGDPHALRALTSSGLAPVERELESKLQTLFGWKEAAVSAKLEIRTKQPRDESPHGAASGQNALSPVIVTIA